MRRVLLFLMLVSVLAQSKGQNKYFPDGTRWKVVMCETTKWGDLHAIVDDNTPEYISIVNGDTVVYNVLSTWDDGKVVESQIYKKVIVRKEFGFGHETEYDVELFREQGDSIFLYSNDEEVLVYDFHDWHEGKEMPDGMTIEKLQSIQLNDGNTYDYWANGHIIRYVGGLLNGIIPRLEPAEGGRIWQLAYFVRNGVTIYDNMTILYDESSETSISHCSAEDKTSFLYSLQGRSISADSRRVPGIYIKNGRKMVYR